MKGFAYIALAALAAVSTHAHVGLRVPLDEHIITPSSAWQASPITSSASFAMPAEHMTVYFMMKHEKQHVQELEAIFYAVSDPDNAMYGKHLSLEEIERLTPISQEKIDAVEKFLEGVDAEKEYNHNKDMLKVKLHYSDVEKLFDTKVARFTHKTGLTLLRATTTPSVPAWISEAIYTVGDLVTLPKVRQNKRANVTAAAPSVGAWSNQCTGLSGCSGLITPYVLRERYNIPANSEAVDKNSMAVAEFQGQYFKKSDLEAFNSGCKVNVNVAKVVGGNEDTAGIEAELDIEYIGALAPEVPLTVIYSSEYSLLNWAQQISTMTDAPLVHSVSYGNDEKQQTGVSYMDSVNVQFMKAGTRGLTIMFASGDQGVCGREGCGIFVKRFKPDFPGGSPYITMVGGTDFVTKSVVGDEKVWSDGGGGFSDTFDIPAYQKDAVAAYKAAPDADLPPQSWWNNTGRGYPDIAALGGQVNSYCVVVNGMANGVAGTSASCPTAASVFAKLNGIRLKNGKSPLGFLNPFIYKNGAAFNDVTQGTNPGNGKYGFKAIKGWDAASGWGTPDFEKLSKLM